MSYLECIHIKFHFADRAVNISFLQKIVYAVMAVNVVWQNANGARISTK